MELTSLEPRRKGLTQLYLDGEPGPKLDTEVVLLARLQPGDILSEEELQELVERSDARRAQEKALYLLANTDLKIYEISEASGYMDYFYFTRVFRKFTGLTPSEWREHRKDGPE